MSILEKFSKNKKGGFALRDENYHPLEKPLRNGLRVFTHCISIWG